MYRNNRYLAITLPNLLVFGKCKKSETFSKTVAQVRLFFALFPFLVNSKLNISYCICCKCCKFSFKIHLDQKGKYLVWKAEGHTFDNRSTCYLLYAWGAFSEQIYIHLSMPIGQIYLHSHIQSILKFRCILHTSIAGGRKLHLYECMKTFKYKHNRLFSQIQYLLRWTARVLFQLANILDLGLVNRENSSGRIGLKIV